MRRNLSLSGLNGVDWRSPAVYMRVVLGVLLLGNVVALYFLLYPPGGSLEEVENRLVTLRQRGMAQTRSLGEMRALSEKVEASRKAGEEFFARYFLDRRKTASTIVKELSEMARAAGIKAKEHAFILEPVEGAPDLSMMTVNGAYEGTYADLIQFVYRVDRSPRFLIIENLTAAPVQDSGVLNVSIRFHAFVKEGPGS